MKTEATRRLARIENKAMITLFVVVICLPLTDNALELDPLPRVTENRQLARLPQFRWTWGSLVEFPKGFESYHNDHLGFRNTLIRLNNWVHIRWLRVSPIPATVLVGREGWLFYVPHSVEYYRGTKPLTKKKAAAWSRILLERSEWLSRQGISYLFLVVPQKHTIYPEFLPRRITQVRKDSRLDQWIRYLERHSDMEMLDLRAPLIEAKKQNLLYHRNGTHWNGEGAYVGYKELITRLSQPFPQLRPLPRTALQVRPRQKKDVALSALMKMTDALYEEQLLLLPKEPTAWRVDNVPIADEVVEKGHEHFAMETRKVSLPCAVMFRDSFTDSMVQCLSEHFERIAYVWKPEFDSEVILKERPDVVIHQVPERGLLYGKLFNPLDVSHESLKRKYDASEEVLFALGSSAHSKGITLLPGTSGGRTPGGMTLKSKNRAPGIALPTISCASTMLPIVQMELSSPEDAELDVLYETIVPSRKVKVLSLTDRIKTLLGQPVPDRVQTEECGFTGRITKGRRSYYVCLDGEQLAGQIRLRFTPGSGPYKMHALEIRGWPVPLD